MDYTVGEQPMISSIGRAEEQPLYMVVRDKQNLRWLVGLRTNAAQHIYVEDRDPKSQGFGGSTLIFHTLEGTIELKGPWMTNADALFNATGVDLRDKHYTWGIISMGRGADSKHRTIMKDVIYQDKGPVLGFYKRIEHMAQEIARQTNQTVYYYNQSEGGSQCGPVNPK